jgi:hypothetical protein
MKSMTRLLAFTVIACAVLAGPGLGASSAACEGGGLETGRAVAAITKASLSPVLSFVAPGQTCAVSVVVESAGDSLGCIECWVTYDTAFVSIVLAEEGALFKNAPYPRIFFTPQIAPDTRSVEGCLLGAGTYCTTPGEIARYVFKAKKAGTCPVRITRLNLWDIRRVKYEPVFDPNAWIIIGTNTGIEPPAANTGALACFPNPFNPTTTLIFTPADPFGSAGESRVRVGVYTADGRTVRTLFEGRVGPEGGRFVWDGKDGGEQDVASGVYFAVAETDGGTFRTKIVLVR